MHPLTNSNLTHTALFRAELMLLIKQSIHFVISLLRVCTMSSFCFLRKHLTFVTDCLKCKNTNKNYFQMSQDFIFLWLGTHSLNNYLHQDTFSWLGSIISVLMPASQPLIPPLPPGPASSTLWFPLIPDITKVFTSH